MIVWLLLFAFKDRDASVEVESGYSLPNFTPYD